VFGRTATAFALDGDRLFRCLGTTNKDSYMGSRKVADNWCVPALDPFRVPMIALKAPWSIDTTSKKMALLRDAFALKATAVFRRRI
jgi:hypothetical protein